MRRGLSNYSWKTAWRLNKKTPDEATSSGAPLARWVWASITQASRRGKNFNGFFMDRATGAD